MNAWKTGKKCREPKENTRVVLEGAFEQPETVNNLYCKAVCEHSSGGPYFIPLEWVCHFLAHVAGCE